MPRISPADREACVARYLSGVPAHVIGREYGLSNVAVLGLVRRRGHRVRSNHESHQTHPIDHAYFRRITDEARAYWLGFMLADGCVHRGQVRLSLGIKDADHVRKFQAAIRSTHKVHVTHSRGWGGATIGFSVRSAQMAADLAAQGVGERKSLGCVPVVPAGDLARHFWRGVVDGDGSIHSTRTNEMVRLVGSEATCRSFAEWSISTCRIRVNVHPHKNIWQARTGGVRQCAALLDRLYYGSEISLPRKAERASEIIAAVNIRSRARADVMRPMLTGGETAQAA